MTLGKTIRIYLADASVTGVRHGEIVNWTGQAICCPRSRFQSLSDWPEARRPGVYFLFGIDEESGQDAVYIGEAEVVSDRLANHIREKDFWSEVVAFTSKDDNLTKGHIRYLESRLIEIAKDVGRYVVKNSNAPQLPALPRPDRDAMEEYLETGRTLLGVLGHKVLEPLIERVKKIDQKSTDNTTSGIEPPSPLCPPILASFHLNISGIHASAEKTDEGFVVVQGSHAALYAQPSLSSGYRALRNKLEQTGILVKTGTDFEFSKDQLFSSPSQAAAIVVGYSINGREAWCLEDGTTYKAYEERLSDTIKVPIEREA